MTYIKIRTVIDNKIASILIGVLFKRSLMFNSSFKDIFGRPKTLLNCDVAIIKAAADVKPSKTCSGILSNMLPALTKAKAI